MDVMISQIDKIRLQLLDLGLRGNTLLNFSPRGTKYVSVTDEKSTSIYDILVNQNKAMSFLPRPEAYDKEEETFKDNELPDDYIKLPPLKEYLAEVKGNERYEDLQLQTKYSSEQLDLRLLKIENESNAVFQERGVDILYLALGFLYWYESHNSTKKRYAPLILLPVEMKRKRAGSGFKINYTGVQLLPNETLYAKLKNDFKIQMPNWDHFFHDDPNPQGYFDAVAKIVENQNRWHVETDKIELGFFSFGKFQMYKDLDPQSWPKDKPLKENPLLKALFVSGFQKDAELLNGYSTRDRLQEIREPESLCLVKDADSSQIEAVSGVLAGANTVIQGPPGTGKSQTITNLIAEALARGKTILFVAQKLTALEVVKKRLDECHIGSAVLELHSHKSRPKDILESLRSTVEQPRPQIPDRITEKERLKECRCHLDEYTSAIGKPSPICGSNYVEALGHFMEHRSHLNHIDAPDLSHNAFQRLDSSGLNRLDILLKSITSHLDTMGGIEEHPFSEINIIEASPVLQEQLVQKLSVGQNLLEELTQKASILAKALKLPVVECFNQLDDLSRATQRAIDAPRLEGVNLDTGDWAERSQGIVTALDAGLATMQLRQECEERFLSQALGDDPEECLLRIRRGLINRVGKWWRFFSKEYRQAKNELQSICIDSLPKDSKLYLQWVDDMLELREKDKVWQTKSSLLASLFGVQWEGQNSDWNVLQQLAEWVFDLHDQIGRGELPESLKSLFQGGDDFSWLQDDLDQLKIKFKRWEMWKVELDELLSFAPDSKLYRDNITISECKFLLNGWNGNINGLYSMARLNKLIFDLKEQGLEELASRIKSWQYDGNTFYHFVWYHYWAQSVNQCYGQSDCLKYFDRVAHEGLISEFAKLDQKSFAFSQESLVGRLYEELPNRNAPGEMSVLRRELNKKRRLIPVRKLLEQAGGVIQKAKPVFMMSPMSTATFLPQGKLDFDLVIFDEASQVTVPDSIGALTRAKQAVVVGDSKQMPPTNFFSRSVEVDDEEMNNDATAEIESVLGLFLAQGAPEKMLRWHYRSKHDSLIYTSNLEFYGGHLKVFPSSGSFCDATGLELVHLPDTVYDKGRTRVNKKEAGAVAKAVLEHARLRPHLSLGVVAFSMAQKEAILIEVESLRRNHPRLESFFSSSPNGESFFVKNLENVQGDERDVIYISLGYGKTSSGVLSKNFGPLNKAGGERRLNVLISRAKQSMKVFSNFTADDIKTNYDSPAGVHVLKAFLNYAMTHDYEMAKETGREMDSPFEESVYKAICGLGYDVVPQVGSQGFFIDMAIRHPHYPGQYLLAVECDGASYHSSANARDRDRLRQAVLENLGWRFHRIWSTDWFRNPKQEVERLKAHIEKEVQNATATNRFSTNVPQEKNQPPEPTLHMFKTHDSVPEPEMYNAKKLTDYAHWVDFNSFYEIPEEEMLKAIEEVVEVESPVSIKMISNRLIEAAGITRSTSKIQRRVTQLVKTKCNTDEFKIDGEFVSLPSVAITLRNRMNLSVSERKLELVAPNEIEKGIIEVINEAVSIEAKECYQEVASRIGFKRVTAGMTEILKERTLRLIDSGSISESEGRLIMLQN